MSAPLVTVFRNNTGTEITAARPMNAAEIERVIRTASAKGEKDSLALLKLARFGELRSKKNSLRHDANVIEVHGIEGDYDGERMSIAEAREALSSWGVAALLYSTPTHTDERPRWRVLAWLSKALSGTEQELYEQRRHWTGVLNAILGGVLKSESFALSQCFYFGRIEGRPDPEIITLAGDCIDEIADPPAPVFPASCEHKAKANGATNGKSHDGIGEDRSRDLLVRVANDVRAGKADYEIHAAHAQHPHVLDQADGVRAIQRCINKVREDRAREKTERAHVNASNGADPQANAQAQQESEPRSWPDPINILGEMSAPAFTREDLPAVLSEYPLAYAQATGFDPSLTLSAAVSVAAAALSDEFQIVGESRSQWFQQARLWTLAIGPPGTGKTPAQKAMLAPLWAVQKQLREKWEAQCAVMMASPEEKQIQKIQPPPKLIIANATIEALSDALAENPRGILLATDEFESWLGSLDRYRSGGGASADRGEWLQLFDGGPHTVERVKRGSFYIKNWGASILTATTPAALARLTRALPEDGLLQRFIPVIARRQSEPAENAHQDLDGARKRYEHTITSLFCAQPRAHHGCVPLSIEAQQYLSEWRTSNRLAQEAFGAIEPAFEAHLSKYPAFLLRLCLTFHAAAVVNHEHEYARDPAAFPVTLETMQTAAKFLERASLHANALYLDRKGGSEVWELARNVARFILSRAWTAVAKRDLVGKVPAFRKADEHQQGAVLRLLVDVGWLAYGEGGYAKSTPARYDVNPVLPAKFAAIAEQERVRREIIREAIAGSASERRSEREDG
jgi:hypothetical protein